MTTEEVQAYVDKKYPGIHLTVKRHRGQEMVFDISGNIGFVCCLGERENLDLIEERLLVALERAKESIKHNIAKIRG